MKPPETEMILLGALLEAEDQGALLDLCGWDAKQLYDPRVRTAWGLMRQFAPRRKRMDALAIWSAGKAANAYSDADREWLVSLQAGNVLTSDSFMQLAGDMRRALSGRAVIEQMRSIAEHINRNGLNPGFVSGALESIATGLARDHVEDQTADAELMELIAEPDMRKDSGGQLIVPTGIRVIDEQIAGFVPNLNVILSDPAIGKNSVITSMITAQATAGIKVGVFGLEEGSRFLSKRNLALQLGMPVRMVGAQPWTREQQEKLSSPEMAALHEAFGRIQIYNHDGLTSDELIRRATGWVLKHGVQCIYIDHIGEIRHRVSEGSGYNWAVADSYRKLRDFAKRYTVPVVMLAHRKPEAVGRVGPPKPDDVGLTGEAHKMVRLMLGLWKKRQSLRCTIIKMNEGPDEKPTFELERHLEAAMVDPAKGAVLSLEREGREDRDAKKRAAFEESKADKIQWEQWRDERKAQKQTKKEPAKAPEAQQKLLDVPGTEKP